MKGWKTYFGVALAAAAVICPAVGAPIIATYILGAVGTAFGIYGRVSVGGRLADESAKVVELANQVEVLRQYAQGKK